MALAVSLARPNASPILHGQTADKEYAARTT